MAQELEAGVHGEAELIEIATRLACEGYWQDIKQVMKVSKVFRYDEQLWDAMKDEPGGGTKGRTRLMYAAGQGDLERVCFGGVCLQQFYLPFYRFYTAGVCYLYTHQSPSQVYLLADARA